MGSLSAGHLSAAAMNKTNTQLHPIEDYLISLVLHQTANYGVFSFMPRPPFHHGFVYHWYQRSLKPGFVVGTCKQSQITRGWSFFFWGGGMK